MAGFWYCDDLYLQFTIKTLQLTNYEARSTGT